MLHILSRPSPSPHIYIFFYFLLHCGCHNNGCYNDVIDLPPPSIISAGLKYDLRVNKKTTHHNSMNYYNESLEGTEKLVQGISDKFYKVPVL